MPLCLAIDRGYKDIADSLLLHGADPNITCFDHPLQEEAIAKQRFGVAENIQHFVIA
jgi:hypothetical protein